MITQVKPKYRVWSGRPSLVRKHKHQLSQSQSLVNDFISLYIDLTMGHFQYVHKQYIFLPYRMKTSHSVFYIQCWDLLRFMISPLYVEVTFSQCYLVINGIKETKKMTGMQKGFWLLYISER